MHPGGLRLKFEPQAQPVFGLDPNLVVKYLTLQYNTKAIAWRAQHGVFVGKNLGRKI